MRPRLLAALAVLALVAAAPAGADGVDDAASLAPPPPRPWELYEDPSLRRMWELDAIAPFEDRAPLWDRIDPALQAQMRDALQKLNLTGPVRRRKLALVLVDISKLDKPRVASFNGDVMMYAASLPKIAVLLGAFEKIAEGRMVYDSRTEQELVDMIRVSSNRAATNMMNKVGKEYIARVLLSPRYRLYDPEHNGGLWVGKNYAKTGMWRRDPLHNLSHGATAMQVARFYYLLQTGNLVTPEYSREMKKILSRPALQHKFVSALNKVNPAAVLFRKSGTWRTYHADSVLVERGRKSYIAVVLADDPRGSTWIGQLAVAMDGIIFGKSWLHRLAGLR